LPRLWRPSSFSRHLFSSMKKVGSPSLTMTFCLSSLDFKVMKVFVRIWFNDVHSGHCNGAWAMASRIWWLSWPFKNQVASSFGV
jgi:hypothetical protein